MASLLLLELPRLPVLNDLIISHRKLVAQVEARSQQRLVVKLSEEDASLVVACVPEYAWLALYTVSDSLPVWENAWRHIRYSLAPAMTPNCKIVLPGERLRLEEINMPDELASVLAGQAVDAEALPEARAGTLRFDINDLPDSLPFLVGDDGILWNPDYSRLNPPEGRRI